MKVYTLLLPLMLVACSDEPRPILRVPEPVVFIPEDRFFVCPVVRDFPDFTTLTDSEVAELLIRLDTNNRTCRSSINAIRDQLLEARAQLEIEE